MTIAARLIALERVLRQPEPHRHSIARVLVMEPPEPDDAALRRWEDEQPACTCSTPDIGVCVVGRAGRVETLQETLL